MKSREQIALRGICFIYDGFFNLYPTPLERLDAKLQIGTKGRDPRHTFALWCMHIFTFLQKLISFLYRCTLAEISGYFVLHFMVLSNAAMGLLCALIFRIKSDEALTYFRYSSSLRQQFAGNGKRYQI